MRDFDDSTLWEVSAFEKVRWETGSSGFQRLEGGPTLLSATLVADLRRLEERQLEADPLEIIAACMRNRENVLMCLEYEKLVWPITLFPQQMLYHSPRDLIAMAGPNRLTGMRVLMTEPPGVRPPGYWLNSAPSGTTECYRPLVPLLWAIALKGPRGALLSEIGGRAAYRLVVNSAQDRPAAPGALGLAATRLRQATVALKDIAGWPGMDLERASRLLNALYLTGNLLVSRTHPAARDEPRPGRR